MIAENFSRENSIADERNLLRTIIDNIPVCIYAKDLEYRKMLANKQELKQSGFASETEVFGKTDSELYGENIGEETLSEDQKVIINGEKILGQEKQLANGDWALISKLPLKDKEEKIIGMVGVTVNCTEQKKYREQLEVFYRLFDDLSDAIQITTEEGKMFYINKEACKRFGIHQSKISEYSIFDIDNSFKDIEEWKKYVDSLHDKKEATVEKSYIDPLTGESSPVEVRTKYIEINNNKFIVATSRDIAIRKKYETELKISYERLNELSIQSKTFAWEINESGLFTYMSPIVENVLGYKVSEIVNKMYFYDILAPQNLAKVRAEARQIIESRQSAINYEKLGITKTNKEIWLSTNCSPMFDQRGKFLGYRGSDTDISQYKELLKTLETARINAEKSAKAKELFLTNMSHEIRTPLNVIIGMIREIGKEQLSKNQQNYLKFAESSAYHLLSIINNVLDMSKIEAGEFQLDIKDFSMSAVLSNVRSILSSRASGKKINFDVNSSDNIARALLGDSLRLSQVLINLLGNSIKFTDQGYVNLSVTLVENDSDYQRIRFEISDSGIGMSEDFLQNIFKKFTQENDQSNRNHEGTGLGMSISREIVEMMGGEIRIKSKKGIGTTIQFEIIFPFGIEDKLIQIDKATHNYDISGTRILIVEDNEMNRFIAHQSLKQAKCVIDEADNGKTAIEKLKTNQYDIILMDIQMPEMDGIEATKIIRNIMNIKTPVIALTANAFKHDIDLYLNIGMNDFLIKPYKEEELFSKIETNCRFNKHDKFMKNTDIVLNKIDQIERNYLNEFDKIPLYNISQLKVIANGDDKFVDKMLEIFENIASDTISQMSSALTNNDIDAIKHLAHKIKPSLDNMDVNILHDEIRALENFNILVNCPENLKKMVIFVEDILSKIVLDIQKRRQLVLS